MRAAALYRLYRLAAIVTKSLSTIGRSVVLAGEIIAWTFRGVL